MSRKRQIALVIVMALGVFMIKTGGANASSPTNEYASWFDGKTSTIAYNGGDYVQTVAYGTILKTKTPDGSVLWFKQSKHQLIRNGFVNYTGNGAFFQVPWNGRPIALYRTFTSKGKSYPVKATVADLSISDDRLPTEIPTYYGGKGGCDVSCGK